MHKQTVFIVSFIVSTFASGLIPPRIITSLEPTYPPELKMSGIEGTVAVSILVDELGEVELVTLTKSVHKILDSLSLETAKKLKFSPAMMDEEWVASEIPYEFEFSLKDDLEKLDDEIRIHGDLTRKGSVEKLANRIVRYTPTDSVLFGLPANRVIEHLGRFYKQSRDEKSLVAKTDSLGRFAFRGVPEGAFTIAVETDEYKPIELKSSLGDSNRVLALIAEPIDFNPYEVVSTYRSAEQISSYSITSDQISHAAGTSGDPIRAIQTLPSVARTSRKSQPVIRGSRPEDSQLYFDGIELPYMFHNSGFKSVIPGPIISGVTLLPSGYGAYYGNSIGGVVSATSDTISHKRVNGYVDINTLDMGGFVDANVVKELRLSAGGRLSERFGLMKTYTDYFEGDKGIVPAYADYFGKLQYRLFDRNNLNVTFIGSRDELTTIRRDPWDPRELKAFNRLSFGWVRDRENNYSHECYYGHSYSAIEANNTELNVYGQRYNTYAKRNLLRTKFNWFAKENLTISSGVHFSGNQLFEGLERYWVATDTSNDTITQITATSGDFVVAPWVEATYHPSENLQIQLGGRYDYCNRSDLIGTWYPTFTPGSEKATYHAGDPAIRSSVWYQIDKKQRIKFGLGNYNQFPKQPISSYEDIYVRHVIPTTKAAHYTSGYELQLSEKLEIDVQAYYNRRWNLPYLIDATNPQSQVYTGKGKSKGIELLLKRGRTEHFEGWLAYSLSHSEEKTFADYVPTDNDQTQNIQVVGTFYFPKKWEIGTRGLYTTGNPYTPIDSIYPIQAENGTTSYALARGEQNSVRRDPSVQFNFRVSKSFVKTRRTTEIYLDCGNILYPLYKTAEFHSFDASKGTVTEYYEPPIPSLGVKVSF